MMRKNLPILWLMMAPATWAAGPPPEIPPPRTPPPYRVSVGDYMQQYDRDLVPCLSLHAGKEIATDLAQRQVATVRRGKNGAIQEIHLNQSASLPTALQKMVLHPAGHAGQAAELMDRKNQPRGWLWPDGRILLHVEEGGDSGFRIGLLTDGKKTYGNQAAVHYVFWRTPAEASFVTVTFDLKRSRRIRRILVCGMNHSTSYGVDGINLWLSDDDVAYRPVGDRVHNARLNQVGPWEQPLNAADQSARFVRITTWVRPNSHVDLTEIQIRTDDQTRKE